MKKEEVKLLMKQNQVKQWEVAEAMGISEFTLCRWLRKDLKGAKRRRMERRSNNGTSYDKRGCKAA